MTKKKLILNLAVFLLFGVSLLVEQLTGQEFVKLLPGILMLYFLPGHNLNEIILFRKESKISWTTRLSIDIVSSITIIYIGYNLVKSQVEYSETSSYIFIIALNLICLIASWLFGRKEIKKINLVRFFKEQKTVIMIMSIPILLFAIRLIFNPYIHEIDSRQYFYVLRDILDKGYDSSWMTGQRNGFSLFMVYSQFIAGVSFIGFFKIFTPLLFYICAGVIFDFIKHFKNKYFILATYLLTIASPFLIISNEGVRPETFIFIFSFPILYLIYYSIKKTDIISSILALIMSYVAFRFHEFGIFNLFASFLGLLLICYRVRSQGWSFIKTKPLLSAIVALPYLVLLAQNRSVLTSFWSAEIFKNIVPTVTNLINHPIWHWWFLSSFTTVDGGVIQWPGLSFVFYYLYNGITLVILFAILLSFLLKKHLRKKIAPDFFWQLFPIFGFMLAYFSIAEILPRLGFFLFPNRTWPHISLALVFSSVIIIAELYRLQSPLLKSKIFIAAMWIVVISGLGGATYGTIFMGGQVLPAEKKVINEIKKLPEDSILVSTQVNENLVEIYGQKNFIPIGQKLFSDKDAFNKSISDGFASFRSHKLKSLLQIYRADQITASIIYRGKEKVHFVQEDTPYTADSDKLEFIRQKAPDEYATIMADYSEFEDISQKPIYFVYSFAKFKGLLAQRDWWINDCDPNNLEYLKEYSGSNVVYKDANAILIKIK